MSRRLKRAFYLMALTHVVLAVFLALVLVFGAHQKHDTAPLWVAAVGSTAYGVLYVMNILCFTPRGSRPPCG